MKDSGASGVRVQYPGTDGSDVWERSPIAPGPRGTGGTRDKLAWTHVIQIDKTKGFFHLMHAFELARAIFKEALWEFAALILWSMRQIGNEGY